MFVLDTGTIGCNEQLLEAIFGTMKSRQGSDCHVATSPRRNVSRRDVSTSRHLHVATSPLRDVSSKICTSSFKVRMAHKLGDGETYEERHGIPEQIDRDFEEVPGIWTVSHS